MTGFRPAARVAAVTLGIAVTGLLAWRAAVGRRPARPLPDFGPAPAFQMTDQTGGTFDSTDLAGKVWMADFIFTRCGGPCPILSKAFARFQREFADRADAAFVSFTVDPAHDTPSVLAAYGDRHGADPARWHFLTGPPDAVRELIQGGFKLSALDNPGAPSDRAVVHSAKVVLVDRAGRVRGHYDGTESKEAARLAKDMKGLLRLME